ncbi:hypothetical protein, partial [Fructobacillus fructosus]|uniref:hypothetical protein n=1 Tax=Fructobacillus fructosus TaxID=1631 RepID=UPI0030C7C2F1
CGTFATFVALCGTFATFVALCGTFATFVALCGTFATFPNGLINKTVWLLLRSARGPCPHPSTSLLLTGLNIILINHIICMKKEDSCEPSF